MPRHLQYNISCTTVLANLLLPKFSHFFTSSVSVFIDENNTMFRIYVDFQPTMNKVYIVLNEGLVISYI